jgi:hypothetical protein
MRARSRRLNPIPTNVPATPNGAGTAAAVVWLERRIEEIDPVDRMTDALTLDP